MTTQEKAEVTSQTLASDSVAKIPSDYVQTYRVVRAVNPELVDKYIAHTLIGDPEADALMEQLASLGQQEAARHIRAAMDNPNDSALRDAPPLLLEFFKGIETPADWVDFNALIAGIRMFHRNSRLVLASFVGGALVEGFTTNIAKSFTLTGRARDRGVRRLGQNNRHMLEIFMPHGLAREGDGWKLSVRIRLAHAQARRLLDESDEWDAEVWGVPLHSAHMAYALTNFAARVLKHMKKLGASYTDEEAESFMAVWRYSGLLMGIPEALLFKDLADAEAIFDIGQMCEPFGGDESIIMMNALVNSAPLVIGITEPYERRKLVSFIYKVSRALVGDNLADQARFPSALTFAVLPWFRTQERYYQLLHKFFPNYAPINNFTNFTNILQGSTFDEAGITYRLPDHVYAEESSEY